MLFNLLELYDPEFIDTLVSIHIKQGQIKLFAPLPSKQWTFMTFEMTLLMKLAFLLNFEKLRF